jgi:hypothetical protein
MRTRTVTVPVIRDDEGQDDDETVVEDGPTQVDSATMVGIPVRVVHQLTRDFDLTLRNPAESHFFVRAGFEAGADYWAFLCAVLWPLAGILGDLWDTVLVLARLKYRPATGRARWQGDRPRPDPQAAAWQRRINEGDRRDPSGTC